MARVGTDIDEFIRREYIINGWLQGYLPLTASLADPALTIRKLAQYAHCHYKNPTYRRDGPRFRYRSPGGATPR